MLFNIEKLFEVKSQIRKLTFLSLINLEIIDFFLYLSYMNFTNPNEKYFARTNNSKTSRNSDK